MHGLGVASRCLKMYTNCVTVDGPVYIGIYVTFFSQMKFATLCQSAAKDARHDK